MPRPAAGTRIRSTRRVSATGTAGSGRATLGPGRARHRPAWRRQHPGTPLVRARECRSPDTRRSTRSSRPRPPVSRLRLRSAADAASRGHRRRRAAGRLVVAGAGHRHRRHDHQHRGRDRRLPAVACRWPTRSRAYFESLVAAQQSGGVPPALDPVPGARLPGPGDPDPARRRRAAWSTTWRSCAGSPRRPGKMVCGLRVVPVDQRPIRRAAELERHRDPRRRSGCCPALGPDARPRLALSCSTWWTPCSRSGSPSARPSTTWPRRPRWSGLADRPYPRRQVTNVVSHFMVGIGSDGATGRYIDPRSERSGRSHPTSLRARGPHVQ